MIPVIEDWHAKMCYMKVSVLALAPSQQHVKWEWIQHVIIIEFLVHSLQVIWGRLYKSCSAMEKGTLFQLRNLINRRNVVSDVIKHLTACEEIMEVVTVAHVISAAINTAGVADIKESSVKILSSDDHLSAVTSIFKTVCGQLVSIAFPMESQRVFDKTDRVVEYAKETMSLGLLLLEFKDGIHEGDGTRVL